MSSSSGRIALDPISNGCVWSRGGCSVLIEARPGSSGKCGNEALLHLRIIPEDGQPNRKETDIRCRHHHFLNHALGHPARFKSVGKHGCMPPDCLPLHPAFISLRSLLRAPVESDQFDQVTRAAVHFGTEIVSRLHETIASVCKSKNGIVLVRPEHVLVSVIVVALDGVAGFAGEQEICPFKFKMWKVFLRCLVFHFQ